MRPGQIVYSCKDLDFIVYLRDMVGIVVTILREKPLNKSRTTVATSFFSNKFCDPLKNICIHMCIHGERQSHRGS